MKDLVIVSVLPIISAYPRHKKSFLFSSIQEWNNLPLETRKLSSPGIFKRSLLKFLHFPSGSYLFCIGDRLAWIFHTRLRLNFSALNYHPFQKHCCPSPACALCDASIEDVKHYFLYCPSFAALCEKLFTSAAKLLGNRWHCASDKKKIDWLLNGISTADFQINLGCPVVFFAMKSLLLVVGCVIYIYIYLFVFFFYSFAFSCVCVRSCSAFVFLKYSNVNSVSSLDEPFRLLEQML